jgi:hypothetical protein
MPRKALAVALGLLLLAPGVSFARPSRHSSALRRDWHSRTSRSDAGAQHDCAAGTHRKAKARSQPPPDGRAKTDTSRTTCRP